MIDMREDAILTKLRETGVVSILRGIPAKNMAATVDALYRGGVQLVEVTFNTPEAADIIQCLAKSHADKLIVGAGTVLDSETARIAILAGAQFVLSPSFSADVLEMCARYSVLAVPGVMTPTEAVAAWSAGARVVKIFPAGVLGPQYIKQLLGPLDQLEVMAVGGVNEDNFAGFLQAGASSAGIGGELVSKAAVAAGDYEQIYEKAKSFTEIFKQIKGGVKGESSSF